MTKAKPKPKAKAKTPPEEELLSVAEYDKALLEHSPKTIRRLAASVRPYSKALFDRYIALAREKEKAKK